VNEKRPASQPKARRFAVSSGKRMMTIFLSYHRVNARQKNVEKAAEDADWAAALAVASGGAV
jgi:hypothetical protein